MKLMRRVVVVIVLLSVNPVWALTFMGPPTSDLKQKEWRTGFDYSTGEFDIDVSRSGPVTFRDLDIDNEAFFGLVGAAPFDETELFVRLGRAGLAGSGTEFAWGAGFKATVFDSSLAPWGVLFQITHTEGDDSYVDSGSLVTADFDLYEMQIAVGPSYQQGNVCIYGGPFLHFVNGDVDLGIAGQKSSYDIEDESVFGGYIGLSAEIAENVSLAFEGQFTSDASVFGVGATVKF